MDKLADLDIIQVNAVYLHIDCEEGPSRELREYFSFFVPNYWYNPKYKQKMWDGKIRLYNSGSGLIYRGLLPHIFEFARDRNYSIDFKLNESFYSRPSEEEVEKMINDLSFSVIGEKGELRPYQKELVTRCLTKGMGTILSPTASGKSPIIYFLTRLFPTNKSLILVPTTLLRDQLFDNFIEYSQKDDWNAEDNIHIIDKGVKDADKNIYISTWQAVYRQKKEWFEKFDTLIIDECHLCDSKSLNAIGKNCINAYNRVGLTGTLKDMVTHELQIEGILGKIYEGQKTKKLMEDGYISTLDIKAISINYPKSISLEIRKASEEEKRNKKRPNIYRNEIDYIVDNKKRNKLILKLADSIEGNVLILFQFVQKHGLPLHELFESESKKDVSLIHGKIKSNDRNDTRKLLDKSRNNNLLASYSTLSTGVSINQIDAIIFASPYKSKIKVLQSIGRGLRKCDSKDHVVVYDIVDNFSVGKTKGYLFRHFMERVNLYTREGFNFEIKDINW